MFKQFTGSSGVGGAQKVCVAVCCSVSVCCIVLQCAAVCCSVL